MKKRNRVVLIGLGCATPQLMFERFADDRPTLTRLRVGALWGPLANVVPPITVPAWARMMSGQAPGDLGVYGSETEGRTIVARCNSRTRARFPVPRIWDTLSAVGRPTRCPRRARHLPAVTYQWLHGRLLPNTA
jgi:predicted AlkP superfamily phosphohydrolase/phosphomutase